MGGHSASFVAADILQHAEGAIDCVLKGEAEAAIAELIDAAGEDRQSIARIPGVVTLGWGRAAAAGRSRVWTICGPPAICLATGTNTSSECSTLVLRSSFRAAVRGTASSAAPGHSSAAVTGW